MFARFEDWSRPGVEPDLEDLINDPIVRLLMRRDNLVPADLLEVVAQARAHLGQPATPPQSKARPAALTNLNSEPDDRGSDANLNSPTTPSAKRKSPESATSGQPRGFCWLGLDAARGRSRPDRIQQAAFQRYRSCRAQVDHRPSMGIAMPVSERARPGADSLIRHAGLAWRSLQRGARTPRVFKRLGNVDMGVIPVEDVSERLLRPGSTCWRLERTDRMALLVDGAAYFPAMKAAMREARHSILLLGWDFDPRVPLQPDLEGAEQSDRLCDLLGRLLAQRPGLHVHILIWDMAWPFAIQRRDRPQRAGRWLPRERLRYRVDGVHPPGAAHHQKILVVDDSIAFCGGCDFTRNRWDTPEHLPVDERRRTADGRPYGPRHDVVMAVDGDAAVALGDLVRERWWRATGEQVKAVFDSSDAWPEDLKPDIRNLSLGIARTEPACNSRPEAREIEALYLEAIASARHWIYLENQYFTSPVIGHALATRLAEPDGPEVVVVCPARSGGRMDRLMMDHARNYLIHRLQVADQHGRFRAFAALAAGDVPITIHSKVMVVDDRLLRVGSANLNNRSLGLDTECDLAIDAGPGDGQTRRAIRGLLDRLLAEHVARPRGQVETALERTGSLILSIEGLNPASGRHLHAFDVARPNLLDTLIGGTNLLDPLGVADNWRPWRRLRLGPHAV